MCNGVCAKASPLLVQGSTRAVPARCIRDGHKKGYCTHRRMLDVTSEGGMPLNKNETELLTRSKHTASLRFQDDPLVPYTEVAN